MKRSRDDVFLSTQIKRAAVSPRGEQSRQVQMSTASSDQRLTQNDALSYLKDIKEHFQDRKDKYQDFLDVMKDFKSQRIDTSGVIMRVKELFKGNRDLILGFNAFLPKGFKITLPLEDEPFLKKKPVDFEEAISFVNKIKARFQGDDHVYKAFLEILNMYRKDSKSIKDVYQEVSLLFQDHADLLVEFTHFLPDTTGAVSIQNADSGRNHILHGDDRGSPMTIARPTHVEKKPALLDGPVNHRDSEQYEKDKEKGEDRQKNDWEHEDSLGHRNRSSCRDDVAINQQRGMPEVESDFRDKVKDRLGDPDIDEKFADCLRSFKSKIVSAAQFRILVSSLLGTHADISEACENFVTYVERNGSFRNNKQVYRSLKVDRDGDDHDWEDQETKRDHDTRERDRYDRGLGQKIPTCASKEKFLSKPVHELDLSNYESCTPSYKLLPENYPIPSASWRTKTDAKVLNDHWVSVTSGSEDYSFKHMRKNQYEESLNRCEDDRFELDMLLESVNSTAKRVEELLDVMNAHTYKFEASFCIEDHLTAVHLRCIERLYGDHGLDVMDVLRKNAPLALPVILTRLKQKQEEWSKCRADFNKVWAEIYSKNYHKSLDYRSFYFKQQDTKNLSAKALVAEIKETIEKTQSEDEMVLAIAGGYTQPTKPHMEFEFTDLEIQEDINQLMKYSCGEVCTPEQCDKVMKIWTTFLEPLLGVSSCPTEEDKNNDVEANNCTKQNSNQNGADEFANCKPAEMSKSGDEMPPEDSIAGGARANNGNTHDGSPSAYASKTGILCDESPVAPGEDNMNMEIDSAEAGHANTDRGMKPTPSQEPKDSDLTKLTSCSTDMVLDEVNVEKHHEGNETRIKVEREEGELSPSRNLEENAFDGDIDIKEEQTLSKIDPSAMETGGGGEEEMCVEEAGLETNANATDGGEESARVSSDSENATENGDDSVSESANGEEFSPEGPDDDENDKKAESDEEADMEDVDETEGEMLNSDRLLRTIKPLTMNLPGALKCKEKITHIFYGNDSFYILFRLHQMLYERMKTAKWHSSSPENKRRFSNDGNSADPYARFKDALQSLLNGSSDNAKYEDECRSLLGAQSYILFTLDKLIHKLVKQLQFIALEEMENKLIQLYTYENSRSPETFSNAVYCENARFLLLDDNLYRMEFFPGSKRFTIQMMRDELNKVDPVAVSMDPYFASYLNDELLAVPDSKQNPGVFLERNKKLYSSRDEDSEACKAMEDLVIRNGVEMKVNCNSLKISYVLNTEDFLYRPKTRRKALYGPRKPRVRSLSRCKWMLKK